MVAQHLIQTQTKIHPAQIMVLAAVVVVLAVVALLVTTSTFTAQPDLLGAMAATASQVLRILAKEQVAAAWAATAQVRCPLMSAGLAVLELITLHGRLQHPRETLAITAAVVAAVREPRAGQAG
jgi:hypothetical protein